MDETPRRSPMTRWRGALAGIVVLAAALRLCNLGTFSLALDETFTMTRASLPFGQMIAACAADADNVPAYLVIAYASLRVGLGDPWIRLVPIAAGLLSIVVWAIWTRRHFGPSAGLLLAGFMALSPFHVRYSQELRAYPYLLLLTGLVMLAADRLRRRRDAGSAVGLAALVAVGWYTHLSFAMLLPPLLGLMLVGAGDGAVDRHRRRPFALALGALTAGFLAFLPWLLHVGHTLRGHMSRGANDWTLDMVARRWQFLTVAAHESDAADWLGLTLVILAAAGIVIAARLDAGRKVLLPALAAVIAGEAMMVVVNRWSQGRYNLAVWPLLAVLVVLGAQRLGALLPSRRLQAALLALVAVVMVGRVDAYHRRGRPHWDRAARAVAEARRPAEPVLAESRWAAACLGYYSRGEVASLDREIGRLRGAIEAAPSSLVLLPRRHRQPAMQWLERRGGLVAVVPGTGRLVRMRPDMLDPTGRWDDGWWPEPAVQLVAASMEPEPVGCLTRWTGLGGPPDERHRWSRLELGDAASARHLWSGWSAIKVAYDDAGFRLVSGREAAVVVETPERQPTRVSLHLWPVQELPTQQLRLLVGERPVGIVELEGRRQTVSFEMPADAWKAGNNLLVLQLRQAVDRGDGRSLPRSAAVSWITLDP